MTLREAQMSWRGCDWDTEFGFRRENLRGLTSRQARLAAEATRGEESEFWKEAFQYLQGVERDAQAAAELAEKAVTLWQLGNRTEAKRLIDDVISLESKYRNPVCYAHLYRHMREPAEES